MYKRQDFVILEEENKLEIETDFKVELLEGTATMVKMGSEAPPEITANFSSNLFIIFSLINHN